MKKQEIAKDPSAVDKWFSLLIHILWTVLLTRFHVSISDGGVVGELARLRVFLACSCALQRLVVSYGCSWLTHWMNCWQNSPEKKVMDMFQGSSWTVSIGTVIRAPHIKSISLDHRTFKNIPLSLRRDYWKSDSQEFWKTPKMARKVAEGLGKMVCFRQTRNFGTMWDRTR